MSELAEKHCVPCEGGVCPLNQVDAENMITKVPEWHLPADHKLIRREFQFKNYYQAIAFVNAIAWMAHRENHHPDIEVSYNRCVVIYTTHAIGGLSDNDFICAAKVNNIFNEGKK